MEELLTVKDAMRVLRISRTLAYYYIRTGQIPSLRIGRGVRIEPRVLAGFIKKRRLPRRAKIGMGV